MAMLLRSAAARALLLRSSASAVAPIAAVAIVASRRLFSHTRSTRSAATNNKGGGDDAQRPIDGRIEEAKEELVGLYLSRTPPPAAAEVAADLAGVVRRFQEAKARQQQHEPEAEFVGEPFEGEELFDTEAYEADASVAEIGRAHV